MLHLKSLRRNLIDPVGSSRHRGGPGGDPGGRTPAGRPAPRGRRRPAAGEGWPSWRFRPGVPSGWWSTPVSTTLESAPLPVSGPRQRAALPVGDPLRLARALPGPGHPHRGPGLRLLRRRVVRRGQLRQQRGRPGLDPAGLADAVTAALSRPAPRRPGRTLGPAVAGRDRRTPGPHARRLPPGRRRRPALRFR